MEKGTLRLSLLSAQQEARVELRTEKGRLPLLSHHVVTELGGTPSRCRENLFLFVCSKANYEAERCLLTQRMSLEAIYRTEVPEVTRCFQTSVRAIPRKHFLFRYRLGTLSSFLIITDLHFHPNALTPGEDSSILFCFVFNLCPHPH